MGGGEVVGDHLERRCGTQRADVQYAPRPLPAGTGKTRSNPSRRPPTKIDMLPVAARWQPPETGASRAWAPTCSTRPPSLCTSPSSMVLISIHAAPLHRPAKTPAGDSMTSHTAWGLGRQVITTSAACASAFGVSAQWAPCSSNGHRRLAVQIVQGQRKTAAQKAPRQLTANVAKADESHPHGLPAQAPSAPSGALKCRCASAWPVLLQRPRHPPAAGCECRSAAYPRAGRRRCRCCGCACFGRSDIRAADATSRRWGRG